MRALLLGMAGSVAACGSGQVSAPPRTLVVALSSDPGQLNPAITTGGGVHTAADLLYNGLVRLDEQLRPQPELARSWDVEANGALYRFHLRRDVRWHDGRPFTAADVTFSFDSVLLRFHARTRASLGAALASIEAPDDSTVEFRFKQPYAPLLQQLDVVEAPIIPRHVYQGTDPQTNPANRAPVGTGPFRFVSWTPGVEIRYAANPDYFGGKPALEHLILRVIPDAGMQVIALEAGEVDWLFGVPGPDRARITSAPGIRLIQTTVNPGGSNCINTIAFNLDRPLFQDLRVRKAVAQAIDRATLVQRVEFGGARPATAPISSGIAFAHAFDLSLPPFDTVAANRLLDAAGWLRSGPAIRTAHQVTGIKDDTPLRFEFAHFPTFSAYGELLRAQLRAVGIELSLVPIEAAVFVDAVFKARSFDTAIISYCNGTDPEIGVRRQYVSSGIAPVPFSNAAGYRNRVVDSLFDAARSSLDPGVRGKLYHQIQELAIRDLPYVWLVETEATRAFAARCSGFTAGAHYAASARCDK